MIQKIITVPDPILRQKSKPVEQIDKKTIQLVRDLKETLKASENPKGIGLSAPQIGVDKRVLVIKNQGEILVVINPQLTFVSKETLNEILSQAQRFMEGCLSVPGYWGFVNRPYQIKTKFQDLKGVWQEMEFTAKEASLFQHEFDHLEGVLFVDRIFQQRGKIYKIEKNEKDEEELVEVTI
ncbi:peptide deformylase [Candidatus Shapirobacteria bacterium CG_4_10_14_0_8_um_filter_39_15]|nr:MAG: peptide deformylase [Candidatus Shapirobacteria bacterium CG_4_10_14_0_8_um_filter_39_15]PJE68359.1 MAG: peptide deformylase [Candidatus Shapirobacteria bacterium CG10_big_fil_rev_8_21_14_0_10_38_8]